MKPQDLLYLTDAKLPLADFHSAGRTWDIYISAFNDTDRVQQTFDRVNAHRKIWWVLPEYGYDPSSELPADAFVFDALNEAELIDKGLASSGISAGGGHVCIDITGFFLSTFCILFGNWRP
ncbi:hypothetical protein ACU4GA_12640 [Methylobacterium oryzae CBMB20]